MGKPNNITNNFVWSLAEKTGRYGITLFTTIILARILQPKEFGVIAIVTVFITIANVFVQNGFGFAVIQRKNATNKDFTFILFFNFIVSLIICLFIFIAAPFIQDYYGMDGLSKIIRVMSLSIIIAAIGNIQQAYVSRNLEFKKLFISTFSAVMVSGGVGILMAWLGYGVWALVVQYMVYNLICTITLAFSSGLKLEGGVTFAELKSTIALGGQFLLTSLIMTMGGELRTLVIGKLYGPTDLAYVNKGQRITNAPMSVVQSSITAVMYPVLSQHQDRLEKIRDIVRRFVQVSSFLIFPTLFALAAVANSLVPFLLTEKWNGCIQYVMLYCFIWLLNPIQMAHLQAIKAMGKGNTLVVLEIVKTVVSILILALTVICFDSILIIVVGLLIAEILCTLITCSIGRKLFAYSYRMQVEDIMVPLLMSTIMFWVVKLVEYLSLGVLPVLILQIIVGVLVYWGFSRLFKPSGYTLAIPMIKGYWDKLKNRF
ncbi:lipopolysaccharide biosynthesis protein [Butyricimonas virosa]|uniref:lipopolysaccharide biosynthesis protein n=1 Tax=Butyricimonas virosa TaxID=544645 RepID=UPI0022E3247D|nr:lipopolysaccharide biosynthesis protein [Butyricimonas virosa]MBR5298419.1 lipopolysaccharide biosynthesis protein [Parabacteroides sp.]